MIKIKIPNNNIPERSYIIDVLFDEFLGLDYKLDIREQEDYEIILEDGKTIIFKDAFFGRFPESKSYLSNKNIPENVNFVSNQFTGWWDTPVIFGDGELKITKDGIVCGADIFASSFFMLTRWEEHVNTTRDIHNRFPATQSLAYKSNFLDRPVVNEYTEMLWNMLSSLGIKQKRKERLFELILTHDVDDIYGQRPWRQAFKAVKMDGFDYLMKKAESFGLRSRFYFMGGGVTKYDNYYKIEEAVKLTERIKRRGHIIGFHPSYDAYINPIQWKREVDLLEKTLKVNVEEGRSHYLRFEVPTTWQIWEDNGMDIDSTCGYVYREGFRCGTCYEYSIFNILSKRPLKLKERPLLAMEHSFITHQNAPPEYMKERIKDLINTVKKFNGKFVLLWHNSSFGLPGYWPGYRKIYEKILRHAIE